MASSKSKSRSKSIKSIAMKMDSCSQVLMMVVAAAVLYMLFSGCGSRVGSTLEKFKFSVGNPCRRGRHCTQNCPFKRAYCPLDGPNQDLCVCGDSNTHTKAQVEEIWDQRFT